MKKNRIVISLFTAGLMASPLANATNGYFSHGYGMKAKGMAGAGIALSQDSIAAATNPAGMVLVGDRTDVGLDLFKPTRGAQITGSNCGPCFSGTIDGNYDGNGKSLFFIPEIGYNKMLGSDMSLGVSVYGNGGMNTQYDTNPFANLGSTGPAGINLEQLFIAPTWAKKLNPEHSIGVALNLVYQTFSATGLQAFGLAGWSSNPAALTNNGKDSSTGVGLRLGWTGELTTALTMGATYQPKTKMSKFSKYAGLFAEQGGFDIPATYGLGIAFKAMPATVIVADYQAIQYSGVPSVGNSIMAGGLLGDANGAGFGWKDVSVLKLGVSHALNDSLTVRAGYSHNTQPIPDNQTFFNILAPGVVQDHLTLGATWNLSSGNELTVGYMHAFKKKVNGADSMLTPTGMPGEANIEMYENSLGVAYSWKM